MKQKKINGVDRSRNGSTQDNCKVVKENRLTLIEKINMTIGEPCYGFQRSYPLELLVKYFQTENDPSDFIKCRNEDEKEDLYDLFKDINQRLLFGSYLQKLVKKNIKGRFTSQQLACIFQAYNGIWLRYEEMEDSIAKSNLFDYIEYEGQVFYDLGDIAAFKAEIESMNTIEFEVFVNLIQELWDFTWKFDEVINILKND